MNTNALTTRERVQTIYKFNIQIITGGGGGEGEGKEMFLKIRCMCGIWDT